jgi:Effector Associated Constant Component 1
VDGELRLLLEEDGADSERVDVLTGYLRRELAQLDVERVRPLPAGEAPPGTRGLDVTAIGGLLVTLGQSATGLAAVVTAIRGWLSRTPGPARTVRLELGGDVIELSQASAEEQDRLVELFLSRHHPAS